MYSRFMENDIFDTRIFGSTLQCRRTQWRVQEFRIVPRGGGEGLKRFYYLYYVIRVFILLLYEINHMSLSEFARSRPVELIIKTR